MSNRWRWLLTLLYPFFAINLLFAFPYAKVIAGATAWQWREGVLTFVARKTMWGRPGGQGWSWVVGYASAEHRERDWLRVHENSHVVQELLWVLLGVAAGAVLTATGHWGWGLIAAFGGIVGFDLTYGGTFFAHWAANGFKEWRHSYLAIPYEQQARSKEEAYRYASVEFRKGRWGDAR